MTNQPDWRTAFVPREKVLDYLLRLDHEKGGSKALFFIQYGFAPQRWEEFAKALVDHAQRNGAARISPSPFGVRYIVEGPLVTPRGHLAMVRSIWFVEHGTSVPRLLTAYPLTRLPS